MTQEEFVAMLEQVPLQEVCKSCNGSGYAPYSDKCGTCDSVGTIPTEFGRRILSLIDRNFRRLVKENL